MKKGKVRKEEKARKEGKGKEDQPQRPKRFGHGVANSLKESVLIRIANTLISTKTLLRKSRQDGKDNVKQVLLPRLNQRRTHISRGALLSQQAEMISLILPRYISRK